MCVERARALGQSGAQAPERGDATEAARLSAAHRLAIGGGFGQGAGESAHGILEAFR